jgi:radical SAM protein with 4Fe4S-binding SPASM domain
MYLLLLLGENKDKSINPFFIVATMPYAIINYDGNVYRCNGRNLTEETAEGILTSEGRIEWKPNVLERRLGKTTFENSMCLSCKMLPVCMGPCSQKCMERNWDDLSPVCSLHALDMTLDEYLYLWTEREFIRRKEEILKDSMLNK